MRMDKLTPAMEHMWEGGTMVNILSSSGKDILTRTKGPRLPSTSMESSRQNRKMLESSKGQIQIRCEGFKVFQMDSPASLPMVTRATLQSLAR